MIGEPTDPFATPLEILPEWYFLHVFQIHSTIPNKLLSVLLMVSVPTGLLIIPFLENVNKFQNPFRRPIATTVFLIGTAIDLIYGQFLNILFIRNKIFSLRIGKKTYFFWRERLFHQSSHERRNDLGTVSERGSVK